MYHFMSGYTSKLAGTERGIKEPKSVFSECFGAPFMPRSAAVYAKVGYRGPKESRDLHPSGYTDNLVFTIDDLNKLNPKTDGVRLGHSVGTKKRKNIILKAIENKFKIFNARVSASGSKS